jgi:hypothetical protein
MDANQALGYVGEKVVEQWFLERGINCRRFEFEPFDALIFHNDRIYRAQIKTTAKDRWTINGGIPSAKYGSDIDLMIFVRQTVDYKYHLYYTLPHEITSTRPRIAAFNEQQLGEAGWNRFLSFMQKDAMPPSVSYQQTTAPTRTRSKLMNALSGLWASCRAW